MKIDIEKLSEVIKVLMSKDEIMTLKERIYEGDLITVKDQFEGDVEDAYDAGISDGEVMMATYILKSLGVDRYATE